MFDNPKNGPIYPTYVPKTDEDGNEIAGVRLPDVTVPLATYTGWNFRKPSIGAPNQLVALQGSYVPFPPAAEARLSRRDPHASVAERYSSRERYMQLIQEAAASLVTGGYLLAGDVPAVVKRASDHFELAVPSRVPATASR